MTLEQAKGLGGLLDGVGANIGRGKRQALELSRRRSDGPSEIPMPLVVRTPLINITRHIIFRLGMRCNLVGTEAVANSLVNTAFALLKRPNCLHYV